MVIFDFRVKEDLVCPLLTVCFVSVSVTLLTTVVFREAKLIVVFLSFGLLDDRVSEASRRASRFDYASAGWSQPSYGRCICYGGCARWSTGRFAVYTRYAAGSS